MNISLPAPGTSIAGSLRTTAGVVLLGALALAPLNFGSTRLLSLELLIALVSAAAVTWAVSCSLGHRWNLPPWIARLGVVAIATVAGAWMFFLHVPELPAFTAKHLSRLSARWPNSMLPRDLPLLITWALAGLGSWFVMVDLARVPTWRLGIAIVMVVTGALVALLGLLQNATHAQGIFWDKGVPMPGAFFGTFFHHTSAGAYLNTTWPLGFALALGSIRSRAMSSRATALIYGSLICSALILAAHSGHISRLPQVLAGVGFIVFTFWVGLWRVVGEVRGLRMALAGLSVLLIVGVLGFGATRLSDIRGRWNQLEWTNLRGGNAATVNPPVSEWPQLMRDDLFVASEHRDYPLGDRGASYATALSAIGERPWFGWGPGGWTAAAAEFSSDPFIRTFYLMVQFTHSDYLQTGVEWGLLGAAGWAIIYLGGPIFALRRLGRRPSHDFVGAAAATALIAVLVQSLIDFPLQVPAVQFNALALSALTWSVPLPPLDRASASPFNFS